jgi:DNA-binding beta-propeller fold protein YncE
MNHWLVTAVLLASVAAAQADTPAVRALPSDVDRSPVDLVLTADERLLITANRTSDSVSLVELPSGRVLDEAPCGHRPAAIAISPAGDRVYVTCTHSGELHCFAIDNSKLVPRGSLHLGFAPVGLAIHPDGAEAFVALSEAGAVAVVDLASMQIRAQIAVGRWPRSLALTSDGRRLAVGLSGEMGVAVVDARERDLLFVESFAGLNLGQIQISSDNRHAYVPWIAYGSNPITAQNIRRGWVIASRIARVRLDTPARREALALDKRGEAVGDPHGLALSPDEAWLAVAASGSHELLVFRTVGLPLMDYGGPGDTIDEALVADSNRFFRIPLGGRPMAIRFARDGDRVFVANYLNSEVQIVSIGQRRIVQAIPLGSAANPSPSRQGEAIFYDAQRSLDQWYSCHSCHYEGGTNAVKMDTRNDGSFGSFKTVLDLHHLEHTGPWTWHGWQTDLSAALRKSLTDTMLGPEPRDDDVAALRAYLASLEPPSNPYRNSDGSLSPAAQRGRQVFASEQGGCSQCHCGPYFTDGELHDLGLGSKTDTYRGFNTPSLLGVHRRVRLLHDGRATSLEQVLTGDHAPQRVSGGQLSDADVADLIAYLRSL